jgi:hypothetical protein
LGSPGGSWRLLSVEEAAAAGQGSGLEAARDPHLLEEGRHAALGASELSGNAREVERVVAGVAAVRRTGDDGASIPYLGRGRT